MASFHASSTTVREEEAFDQPAMSPSGIDEVFGGGEHVVDKGH